ncbi:hypothetical protein SAMN05421505_15912 [Sinosporangium album]|uniref:Uncharacterized protein n=2 Tax=Sinosporangium album TaxID=504805 RepID=A0A1G8L0U2_9ACTN|nr:hypothetical protein SAMN05421505_15912 [Sinosporangium album]
MLVLVGLLVVVAVVAWACSSGSSGPGRTSNAQSNEASPSAAPVLAGLPALTPTPKPSQSPSPSPSKRSQTPKPKPAARERAPGEPCDSKDLVLNLQGKTEVYGAGGRPAFMLTLVNTGKVMCTTDVGPRSVEIRITSGSDRVWSSADCISGDGVDIQRLERGIPYVRTIEWDRRRSARDCSADRAEARPGTYVVGVRAAKLKAPKAVFHLR